MTLDISSAKVSIAGEILAYTQANDEGRDLKGDPIECFKEMSDPDTLCYHQAMKEPEHKNFKDAMVKEVTDWKSNNNYDGVPTSEIPAGATVIPSVWHTRRKKDIITRKIKSYKARLNVDGSRMVKGHDYDQTYAPVASWNAIRLVLSMVLVHNWKTIQLDYVQAFPQAPI